MGRCNPKGREADTAHLKAVIGKNKILLCLFMNILKILNKPSTMSDSRMRKWSVMSKAAEKFNGIRQN